MSLCDRLLTLPRDSGHGAWTHPQLVSRRLSPTCRDAMPKSAMRMLFFSSKSRFSGFRSLWLRQAGGAQASRRPRPPFAIFQRETRLETLIDNFTHVPKWREEYRETSLAGVAQ